LSLSSPHGERSELAAPRVVVVAPAMSAVTSAIVAELRRDALQVDVANLDVLRAPADAPVYVFCLPEVASVDAVVAWAATAEPRPGLIGVVETGDGDARERLLAAGFDDAAAGAISPRELVGRVRAVHRRVFWKGTSHGRLRFGTFTLDLDGHALWIDGKTVALTSIELAVLRELMKARGRPLSRAELLDAAWGEGELEVSERAVDNVMLRLRRKLPRPDVIETVRSVGFRIKD
jgi:DNA-binding response OmpR family regulator